MIDTVTLECAVCHQTKDIGKMDFGGMRPIEKWAAIAAPAGKAGWSVRISLNGLREALCDTCTTREPEQTLPPYSGIDVACAKCRHSKPATVYQRRGEVEYLARTCLNCGFGWVEAPADRLPWWKRLFWRSR